MEVSYDISIIVPYYRGKKYLERLQACIDSCWRAAKHLKIEVIIVNDSPEEKLDLGRSERYRVVNNAGNFGIQYSRIRGINLSRGAYILMLDQDDLLAEYALLVLWENKADYDVVVANGFDENKNSYGPIYPSIKKQRTVQEIKYYFLIGNTIVSPGQCLIKREAIPQLWKENLLQTNGSDDLLLWLIMLKQGKRFGIVSDQLYIHKDTGVNVSLNYSKMIDSVTEVIAVLKRNQLLLSKEEKLLVSRLKMKKLYEGKGKFYKILAYLLHPVISWELIKLK